MSWSEINALEAKVKETVLRLPFIVGNAAVNWTIDSFRVQGFRNISAIGTAWTPRKKSLTNFKDATRAVLVKTGRLKRSYRILSVTDNSVTIGSNLIYAGVHNQGFKGVVSIPAHTRQLYGKAQATSIKTKRGRNVRFVSGETDVKAHTRNMNIPRRQAMPESETDSVVFVKDMQEVIEKTLAPFFK